MHIEEVEAIWGAIDEYDDGATSTRKIAPFANGRGA